MTGKPPYEWMSDRYEYVLICECIEKEIYQVKNKKGACPFDVIIHHKKGEAKVF